MLLRRRDFGLEIASPAKVNLFFEVLAKRADGFHEIETLMAPVDCWDTLIARDDPTGPVRLDCQWAAEVVTEVAAHERFRVGLGELPPPGENLVVRAVLHMQQRLGTDRGLSLELRKRIPAAAGLGGASGDAAAALVAANELWSAGLSTAELMAVAAELGSDVPFFLAGQAAICRGRGEQVTPLAELPTLDVVVVWPGKGLSTADVYRRCRPSASPRSAERLLAAWQGGDLAAVGRELHNALQPAACELSREVGALLTELERLDCLGSQMSGSGSSCFALCRDRSQALAIAEQLRARSAGHVIVAQTISAPPPYAATPNAATPNAVIRDP